MSVERLRIVFLADAVFSAATGLLFLAATWDGLYDALELPQGKPTIFTQVAGALAVGIAYLLWLAARTPALMLPVARAAAVVNGLGAAVIIARLIRGGLGIDTLGKVELIAAALLMSVFTAMYVAAGLRPGGYGPEPPPRP